MVKIINEGTCFCCMKKSTYNIVLEIVERAIVIPSTYKRTVFNIPKYQCICDKCGSDGFFNADLEYTYKLTVDAYQEYALLLHQKGIR